MSLSDAKDADAVGGEPPLPEREVPADPLLRVKKVSKWFQRKGQPDLLAVDRVSFDVPKGAVVALLGSSGCGKSTILRMAAGLETPSDGVVTLEGRPVTGPGRERGMVFQSYTSFPWLTVRANVEYGLRLAGMRPRERRAIAERTLELVHLAKFADAYPSELSGGMRQRVALARAIATEPKLLLLDEPFGALDAQTRWSMQDLLLEVVRETHLTALLVTHDIEEALTLASRIVVLGSHPGSVREEMEPGLPPVTVDNRAELTASADFAAMRLHLLKQLGA